jgi:hypothetical protein
MTTENPKPPEQIPDVTEASSAALCSAAAWRSLAMRLADESTTVLNNAHWEVKCGSGDLLTTIKAVREKYRLETQMLSNYGSASAPHGSCLICGHDKPYAVWSGNIGACLDCREAARAFRSLCEKVRNLQRTIDESTATAIREDTESFMPPNDAS